MIINGFRKDSFNNFSLTHTHTTIMFDGLDSLLLQCWSTIHDLRDSLTLRGNSPMPRGLPLQPPNTYGSAQNLLDIVLFLTKKCFLCNSTTTSKYIWTFYIQGHTKLTGQHTLFSGRGKKSGRTGLKTK